MSVAWVGGRPSGGRDLTALRGAILDPVLGPVLGSRRLRIAVGVLGATGMAAGGWLYAPMPTGGSIGALDVLRDARAWPDARAGGVSLCLAGVLVLTAAWSLLGRAVRRGGAGVREVAGTTAWWTVPLLVAPPLFSGDAWSYAADGYLAGHGLSPYEWTPAVLHGPLVQGVCVCWRHTRAPYGPVPLVWGGAFSRLTSSPWLLMSAYRLLALGGLALLMVALPRLARLAGHPPAQAAWLGFASPLVLADGVGGAHLDLVLAGLVCAALALTASEGWLAGALLVGVATSVKAPAAVAGVGVTLLALRSGAWRHRLRVALRVAAVVLGTTVGLGVASGLGVAWLSTMRVALVLHTPLSLTYDAGRILRGTLHATAPTVADGVGLGLLALGCCWLLLRTPAGAGARLTAAGVAMLLTTVLSPVANYWYYLWCLPLLACCALPRRAWRCLVAGVAVIGVLSPLDPTVPVPDMPTIVLSTLAAALAVALLPERVVAGAWAAARFAARFAARLGGGLAGAPRRCWVWLGARPGRSLVAALALTVALRAPFLAAPFGDDEGGYLYVAQHWPGPGHWLYGGQWVDRPPVLVLVFKLVAALGGTPVVMRMVALAVTGVLVTAAWYAGRRLAGPQAGAAAALCAAALASNPAIVGDELTSDGIGAMFVTVSFALLLTALQQEQAVRDGTRHGRPPAHRWFPASLAGLAGCAAVLAFLSKQSAIVGLVVAAGLLIPRWRRRGGLLVAFGVGVALPLAATVAWAAAGPGLDMFVNAIYTFRVASVRVVAASTSRAPAERVAPFFGVMVVSGLVFALAHLAYDQLTRRRSRGLRALVVAAAVCLAGVIAASVNWYAYYWLAVVPFAAVGLSLAFVPGERRWHARMAPGWVVAATVVVALVDVGCRLPVSTQQPAVSRFIAAAARPRDTLTVVWGQANLLEDTGLRTPYPYSWSLPVRVEDPHLHLFAHLLSGAQAPTWLLEAGPLDSWHLETPRVARLVSDRYRLAAVVCGHDILLRDGVRRALAAGTAATADGRC